MPYYLFMDINKNYSIATLFTRFIIGFGSGFVGMLILAIILFSFQHIVGDFLKTPDSVLDPFGTSLTQQMNGSSLFLWVLVLAAFTATMFTNLTYSFLSLLLEDQYTKRSTTLTHVFFGNLILLIFFLPLYIIVYYNYNTDGVTFVILGHTLVTCFFSISALQILHGVKYVFVNLYGNILGFVLFFFLAVWLGRSLDQILMIFLAFPFFMGIMGLSNRAVEIFYLFLYRKSGADLLSVDTTFGDDYGVPLAKEDFNEDDEFKKEFKI